MVNGMRRYPVGTDLMFPLDNDTVSLIMEHNKDIYNRSLIPADWNSDVEVIKYSNEIFLRNKKAFQLKFNRPLSQVNKFEQFRERRA